MQQTAYALRSKAIPEQWIGFDFDPECLEFYISPVPELMANPNDLDPWLAHRSSFTSKLHEKADVSSRDDIEVVTIRYEVV